MGKKLNASSRSGARRKEGRKGGESGFEDHGNARFVQSKYVSNRGRAFARGSWKVNGASLGSGRLTGVSGQLVN